MDQVAYIAAGVLLFSALLAFAGARLRLASRGVSAAVRYLLGLPILAVYAYGVLLQTIIGRTVGSEHKAELELFWSHRESLSLADGSLVVTNASLLEEILLNVLMFVPLGALLPFLLPRRLGEGPLILSGIGVGIVAGACSLAIELAQWRFNLGLFEFDDILNNTLGALLGFVLYRVVARVLGPHALK